MASNEHGDVKNLDLGPEFQNCKCLNLCELQLILGDQLRLTSKRNEEAQTLIKSSFDYANKFATIKNRSSIVDVRTNLERIGELHEYEIAMLVNLLPKTVQEARYFIPSLIRLSDETLNSILEHLISYKMYVS
ncbi:DNA-directed RNA polymerase II 16 kDa subunit [Plasmodium coatneyi]|uniref:DNA-directed RNA polymerase II 16 kDa subunit n=1 Tax=Plasmodium coatneyi TaxID=208452 RepID=A0A1B1DUR9_9APIC|nr:DNA-directed RNA polymerase II 16 kDa subunit [Plasmodium coatneyi]ANQ06528.1 DNA-directed RNA polymerase II 16 kDa subunit [Plasmodium coatneyi]